MPANESDKAQVTSSHIFATKESGKDHFLLAHGRGEGLEEAMFIDGGQPRDMTNNHCGVDILVFMAKSLKIAGVDDL